MLKKLAVWIICFALSCLESNVFGWMEQGKAFFYIHLIGITLIILITLAIFVILDLYNNERIKNSIETYLCILVLIVVEITLILIETWICTKLFDVDFFVVYQIITFADCLYSFRNTKQKNSLKK